MMRDSSKTCGRLKARDPPNEPVSAEISRLGPGPPGLQSIPLEEGRLGGDGPSGLFRSGDFNPNFPRRWFRSTTIVRRHGILQTPLRTGFTQRNISRFLGPHIQE